MISASYSHESSRSANKHNVIFLTIKKILYWAYLSIIATTKFFSNCSEQNIWKKVTWIQLVTFLSSSHSIWWQHSTHLITSSCLKTSFFQPTSFSFSDPSLVTLLCQTSKFWIIFTNTLANDYKIKLKIDLQQHPKIKCPRINLIRSEKYLSAENHKTLLR